MLNKNDLKEIEKLLKRVSLTKEEGKNFATRKDLEPFATKDDLKPFATKDDLKPFATKDDLKPFATKKDIEDAIIDAASQILEAVDRGFSETANKDDVQDHEKRISKLEQAVFPS